MSGYLTAFQKLNEYRKDLFTLTGDCLLVEVVKEQDLQKTKSGIFIPEKADQLNGVYADKPTFVRVLLVGEGFYDDKTGEDIPLDVKPGDVVLVSGHAIRRFSCFGKLPVKSDVDIAIMKESDIQMRFFGEEAFNKTFEVLQSSEGEK